MHSQPRGYPEVGSMERQLTHGTVPLVVRAALIMKLAIMAARVLRWYHFTNTNLDVVNDLELDMFCDQLIFLLYFSVSWILIMFTYATLFLEGSNTT